MRRGLVLLAMFVAIVVAVVMLGAGAAFAGSNSVTSLGTEETPSGASMQTYRVTLDVEDGYCAATVTQLPDGTLKTQYYKDMDEFEAADDSSADSERTTTTVKTGVSALSEARADLFSPLAVTSQRVVNALGKLKLGGTTYNSLSTRLTYNYNGSQVTSASWWASSGWTSPWTYYGTASVGLGSTPASSVLLFASQTYRTTSGTIYYNGLRNYIRGYGSGTYSAWGEYSIDSRLSGWTYTFTAY
jgi:hypothetical protein